MKQVFGILTVFVFLLNACKTVEIPVLQVEKIPSKVLEEKIENLTGTEGYRKNTDGGDSYLVFTGSVGLPLNIEDISFPGNSDTNSGAETEKLKRAFEFAYLANQIPAFNRYWQTDGSLLWRQYQSYLNNITIPESDTSDRQKQLLKTYNIVKDSCGELYNQFLKLYINALIEYNQAIIQGASETQKEILKLDLESKKEQWISEGCKNEYQAAIAFLEHFGRQSPAIMVNEAVDKLNAALLESAQYGEFYYTTPFPFNITDSMWTSVTLNGNEVLERFLFTGIENKADYINKINLDSVQLSFEILRVNVIRNWFEPAVVSHIKGIDNDYFSFPYVTEMVLIKDLSFSMNPYTKWRTKLIDKEGTIHNIIKKNQSILSFIQKNEGVQIAAFICYFPSWKSTRSN